MKFQTLFTIIVVALIALVAWGILGQAVVMAGAASIGSDAGRSYGCHTYNVNGIFGGVDNQEAVFCGNAESPAKVKHSAESVTVETAVSEAVETVQEPTVNPTESPVDDKPSDDKKCNNGNGNGAEGCNASDKGNQDETPEKGDKDTDHPANGNTALGSIIFLTIRKRGKKENIYANVSSFSMSGTSVVLYVWQQDDPKGEGEMGYIRNAKVTGASESVTTHYSFPKETEGL